MIGRILAAPLTRLLIVALVPAVVLGVFVAALAAADSGGARIPAALVNQDRLVQQTGTDGKTTTVAAGRLVSSGLTKPAGTGSGASIDWTLTNASTAADLLAAGDVYAVVTIPRDFSKSIATVSGTDAQRAEIRITTDDTHGTLVSQLGGVVGDTIASTVGGRITTNVVSGLYGGYASVRTSLLKAAKGADGLGDGVDSLASGLVRTADGGAGLGSGVRSLGSGARQIAEGARPLSSGLDRAASGTASAASGAKTLADGVDDYTDGVTAYTKGVGSFLTGVAPAFDPAAAAGQAELAAGSTAIAAQLRALAAQDPTLSARTKGTLGVLAGKLDGVASGQSTLAAGSRKLASAGAAIPKLQAAGSGLRSGGSSLDAGSSSLASGLAKLPAGVRAAAAGTERLGSAAAQLGSGADRLATGTDQLVVGVRKSAAGASRLADGADELGSGLTAGAKQVPNLTATQRDRVGAVVADPVHAVASRHHELSGPGEIVSTLIVPVGLWIGAAALVLLFGAVRRRLLTTGVGTGRLVGGALVRGAVVAVVQAVLIVALLALALHVDWPALLLLGLVALVAGVAFLAVHQLLQAVFGRAGTVLSIVLLGVQLVAVGGLYPIQLVSAPFQVLSPFLPLTAAVRATTAALTGGSGGDIGAGLIALALWAVLAFVLAVAVVARRRTSTALFAPTPALA